jgi:hypothetical protein
MIWWFYGKKLCAFYWPFLGSSTFRPQNFRQEVSV